VDISAIKALTADEARRYVPPLSDYSAMSAGWEEVEYRHFVGSSSKVVVGLWEGAPGEVTLNPWPYTEVCSILSGRVAIRDQQGEEITFGAGAAFIVPSGFVGQWITMEPTSKLFVAIS
jgi:uncharacterized cupin superfamily protein